MSRTRLLLAAALPLLGSCRPDAPPELPPRLKPLLETLPASYRPFNRQDTLTIYSIAPRILLGAIRACCISASMATTPARFLSNCKAANA